MTDRLDSYLALLTVAAEAYLLRLRELWSAPIGGAPAAEVARVVAGVGARPAPSRSEAAAAHDLIDAAGSGPLAQITEGVGLSEGEEALAAAAWWAEADPQFAIVLGCAHDDAARRYASAALVRRLLAAYGVHAPAALEDDGRLVTHGVIEAGAGAAGPLQLTPTARMVLAGQRPQELWVGQAVPERFTRAVASLARRLASDVGGVVVLRGPEGVGRRAVAADAARSAGLLPVGAGPSGGELRLLAATGIAVGVVPAEQGAELGWTAADGPLIAIAAPGEHVRGGYLVELPAPGFSERRRLWATAVDGSIPDADDELVPALATRFLFTEGGVAETLERARADAVWDDRRLTADAVWDAARRQPEHALDRLAALVAPAFTLDDLVLPAEQTAQMRELVAHVELQHVVLDRWGFRRRMPRGQGVIALFTGPPGTGKTTTAEAVAHALRQDLYRIDLSAVVSKYVGETEKNLSAAFDEAERAGAVLFFDEADSLFGRRTEVKDAHDRYANLEVNYLLQRIETFTGLVLLATNRHSALDEAFARRLRFVIRFEHPDHALRAALWRRSFPPETAVDGLDWDALAVPELSGGSIQAAALSAAYLAAANGGVVTREHVEHALRREHQKLGKAFVGLVGGAAP
jgi:hypothetical protein